MKTDVNQIVTIPLNNDGVSCLIFAFSSLMGRIRRSAPNHHIFNTVDDLHKELVIKYRFKSWVIVFTLQGSLKVKFVFIDNVYI